MVGYYAGYQRDAYPPEVVDYVDVTHLTLASVVPRADGTLTEDFYLDTVEGPPLARQLIAQAHAAGKKVLVMVGGARRASGWAAATTDHFGVLVQNLLALVTSYGADGLDLGWEPATAADGDRLVNLAQALRSQAPEILLTVPVPWFNCNWEQAPPFYAALAQQVDRLGIMSFYMADQWGSWATWHNSPLAGEGPDHPSSLQCTVQRYLDRGIPAGKLHVGISFFGSCWDGPSIPLEPTATGVVASDDVMSLTHIMQSYFEPAARHWDASAKVPYLSFPAGKDPEGELPPCTFISYDDEQSIAEKGAFAAAQGMGGALVWTLNQGYLPWNVGGMPNPYLAAVWAAFMP